VQQKKTSGAQQTAQNTAGGATTAQTPDMFAIQAAYGNQFMTELAQGGDLGGEPVKVSALPGVTAGEHHEFGVAQRDNVEERSERRTDAGNDAFQHMNQDYLLGLTLDPTTADTRGSTPVHMGLEGDTQRGKEAEHLDAVGVHNLYQYRCMVIRDFNFNGLINKYTNARPTDKPSPELRAAGEAPFLADVVARFYPGHQVNDPEVQTCVVIARNIWSYATMGSDIQGRTDVEQLQGLLYVFDEEIRGSSNTNTKMKDPSKEESWFIVPGTEDWDHPIKLLEGDGRHGRATILTTRHLLAGMTTTPPETGMTGFDESYLVLDRSGSMLADEFGDLARLLEAGGIDGELHLGSYNDSAGTLEKVRRGEALTHDEAEALLQTVSDETRAIGREEITGYDQADPALVKAGSSNHEQGLAAALAWATDLEPAADTRRQLLVVTDEPDFNPGVLKDLQKMALKKNLSVKVLYSFNAGQGIAAHGAGNADSYVIIDIMAIDEILNHWKIDREGTQQLDWGRVADSQHAETHGW
jgi:hypothetical protein